MEKIVDIWCWLVSFLPYRKKKLNSVIGMGLKNPLDPIQLKIPKQKQKRRK